MNDQFHHIFTQTAPFLVDKSSLKEDVYVIPQVINLPFLEPKKTKKSKKQEAKKEAERLLLLFRGNMKDQLCSYIPLSEKKKGYNSSIMLLHNVKTEHYFVLHIHLVDCTIAIYDSLRSN